MQPVIDPIYTILPAAILGLPLLAFVVIMCFGKHLDKRADKIAILAMLVSFCLSVALYANVIADRGSHAAADPIVVSFSWLTLGSMDLTMGFLIDGLSAFMSMIVTGLATLVLVYSIFYMDGDTMYRRYFGYMCFFCFAMLGIVLSNNLLMTFVFWELVGLGSYFLIGFWFYKPPVAKDHHYQELKASYATGIDERLLSPAHAQKKGFVMNRVGDFGFIIGLCIFLAVMIRAADLPGNQQFDLRHGPLNFTTLYAAVHAGVFDHVKLMGMTGSTLLTLAGIFTFMGAMGKSAQFPLHTWLPDAMQGPTTGSSIIHAATMVAAGVYMTARIHPLLTTGSLFFVAIIGGITAFLAATMALVQWDIKAVLAYSTISQLGYMMLGLGAGAYTAGVAHLFTHAIFKCMLFLCAGSVIHACHHLQDMNRMGGLRHKLPLTYIAMLTGTLAISGVPLFSGFYSKDMILVGSLARALEYGGLHWLPFLLGIVTAGLTAFYMFRLIFMTFHGEPRDKDVYEHAHESPPIATVPLMILAVLCLGFWWSGKLNLVIADVPLPVLSASAPKFEPAKGGVEVVRESAGWLDRYMVSPATILPETPEAAVTPPDPEILEKQEHNHHLAHWVAMGASLFMVIAGFGVAFMMYIVRSVQPDNLLKIAPLSLAYSLFSQLWFFDRLYQDGCVPAWKAVNSACSWFDSNVVDATVDSTAIVVRTWAQGARNFDNWVVDKMVDAFGWTAWLTGSLSRAAQVGKIQFYVCVTFGIAALLLLGLMLAFP